MSGHEILAKVAAGDRNVEALLTRLGTANPFSSVEYGRAMQAIGRDVWIVGLESTSQEGATLACLKKGRLAVELELPSLPMVARDTRFWEVVDRLCGLVGVTDIIAGSFGSTPFELPPLRGELSRQTRHEFVLPLRSDPLLQLGSNHKRNVKKAQKAGVTIRRTRARLEWLSEHFELMGHSAQRRIGRGESVFISTDTMLYRALLENQAAELFQAVLGRNVLSSVLVLLSPRTAYYQSAGSSPEGMNTGASHFLIHSIAEVLKNEGRHTFNLGGAAEGSSLARFKLGFGPETLILPAATCYVGPVWKRKLRSAIRLARSDRGELIRTLTGNSSRLLVFRLDTETATSAPVAPVPEVQFVPLNEEQLATLPCSIADPDFRNRQMERLHRLGKSYAYAVRVGDTIAHVSWLLPASAIASDIPRILKLREDEAEISGCETAPAFRGKGLYPYAIQCLANLARKQGIRHIYMKTVETNVASQSGIRKAGLKPIGSVRLIHPPLAPSRTIVRRRLAL